MLTSKNVLLKHMLVPEKHVAVQMLSNVNHLAQYLTLTPSGAQKDVYGHWTQTCNAAGVCSDYALGVQNSPCLIANVGGHVADTCSWFCL